MRCQGGDDLSRHPFSVQSLVSLGLSLAMASSQQISPRNLHHARSRKDLLMFSSDPILSLTATTMTLPGNGYDTAQGQEALCWRGRVARYEATISEVMGLPLSPLEDFHLMGRTELLGDCSSQTLQVGSPQVQFFRGNRLRTGESYNFSVQVDVDLSLLLEPGSSQQHVLWTSNAEDVSAQVKLILCDIHTSGFCTPFVHEESVLMGSPQPASGTLHGVTHLDSSTTFLTAHHSSQPLSLEANITIPMQVAIPGEYFVIAALELYTQEISENRALIPLYHRWDIANAIGDGGRVLTFQEPPTLLEMSPKVELVSYIAIALAASVVTGLLISTIYYRNSQILKLTQGWFLILYLTCALTAVVSSFLLNPKSDVYCRLSYPIILTSIQLMYAICCGRLWRLHAVLSPIFQHRDMSGKDDTTQRASGGDNPQAQANNNDRLQLRYRKLLQSCLRCFPFLQNYQTANCSSAGGLKRTVPYWHLNVIVFACTLPQLLLQIASVTRQPQQRVIRWNENESIGRAQCEYVHEPGEEPMVSLLLISFLMLVLFLLVLLAVAFYCRNLPSVGILNESRQIYDTAMTSMILLVLGTGIIRLTDNATSSPDVEYTVWVTVILWTTVNSAMRLMHRKLRMAYQGKTVIVSALVKEHHRKQREKQEVRLKELADRANAFQKCVLPLVKDQMLQAAAMKSCFVGEEAIDALVHEGIVASRWEGLQLGRDLVNDLGLFLPIGGNVQHGAGFQDDFVLYRFRAFDEKSGTLLPESQCMRQLMFRTSVSHRNSSPIEAEIDDVVNQYSREELEELVEGFKAYVDVRDRKYHMRTYHNCFIGSEAVDSMIYAGLAHSREEAVKLGKRLQRELKLFHHVCDDWSFEDKRLFYRMRQKFDPKVTEDGLDEHETDDLPTLTRRKSWSTVMTGSMNSSIGSSIGNSWKIPSATVNTVRSTRKLTKDAKRFIDLVSVRDRKYHMRTYKRVFVGAEAVDSLVYSGMAATRWDAVQIGRTLARELRLFEHVTRVHNFNDDWLFYRYTNTNVPRELCWDDNGSVNFSDAASSDGMERSQLAETADLFRRCIDVRDRKYRGIRYKACFVGSDAVDSVVFSGLVSSRPEAVKLGRYLARELRLFKSVTGSHVFSDEPLLYSFRAGADSTSVSSGGSGRNGAGSHDETASTGRHAKLLETAEAFRKCTDVRDRRYRLRTFKQCFVAVDTVDMMLTNGLAETRHDCVQLARQLARELGLFRHVCDDHDFCDAYLFFEFTGEHGLGVNVGKDGETRYKLERLADCESWNTMGRLAPVPEADSKLSFNSTSEDQSTLPRTISQIASDFEVSDDHATESDEEKGG